MTTTFKGMGGYKAEHFAELTDAFAGREFTFGEASILPSFDQRTFYRLYRAGLLRFSKKGKKGFWRVVQYDRWSQERPFSGSVTA